MNLPEPRRYIPFKSGPFRMAMGLNDLNLNDWIELDTNYHAEMAQKHRLLSEKHNEVFAAQPESENSSREILELLSAHLTSRFPDFFKIDGAQFTNALTGEKLNLAEPAYHPLDAAARLVQEDLCLMQPRGEVFCLTAASVCFPSRWKLREKMGLPLRDIHAPVPFFDKIAGASDQFMQRMTPEKSIWRLNWSLHDSPELFQPVAAAHTGPPVNAENAGETIWLRMERQTLRRLPRTRDILFTIKTYVRPLSEFSRSDLAVEMASALKNLPPETSNYKGLAKFAAPALAWLERRATP